MSKEKEEVFKEYVFFSVYYYLGIFVMICYIILIIINFLNYRQFFLFTSIMSCLFMVFKEVFFFDLYLSFVCVSINIVFFKKNSYN